ncbi:formate/nitrite transporter family protein [Halorussus limi]|uniref:Formate/nitrite transporter family protein n=1 Tax=Halorussus limi TaxID=2938695 RepID=A0A8U0HX65_9EURY|nr:formate/nitrite transporter family protein [Halorussus limi]UPV75429.1 formate/nitrite transporter family protein [Halorussus limi]
MAKEELDRRIETEPPGQGQKSKQEILAEEIQEGLEELRRPADGLFLSGISAGLDIGFGPLFMAVLLTIVGKGWGDPLTRIVVANAYAVGFIFVIGGRSELFTEHTTRASLPVFDGRASVGELARLWALVYGGNILGGSVFAVAMVSFAPAYGIVEPSAFTEIASNLTSHGPWLLLAGGVVAGWLMGLLSWLLTAAKESISRIAVVWLVTTGIGLAHLPHSIAGNVEVLAGTLVSPRISFAQYAGFLALATVGNAVGGSVFVALLKYGHVVRGGGESETG